MESELFAVKEQADEYRRDLTAERESHQHTRANLQSMCQQWQDMYRQLQAKKEKVGKIGRKAQYVSRKVQCILVFA